MSNNTFAQFGKSFQEKLVQALLTDRQYAQQMVEVIDVKFFELQYLQFLADRYIGYAKKYKDFPTLSLLVTIVKDDLKDKNNSVIRDQIIDYLQRMRTNPDMGDLAFVKEKSLDFCRKQALKGALEKAVDLIAEEKYDAVLEVMKKATYVGSTPSVGHNFFQDQEARFNKISRRCVPTGIEFLDKKDILNGGAGKGEIFIIMAPTGCGKSHFLVQMGANAVKCGFNVVHYTFELSETVTGVRYDSNFTGIGASDVLDSKEIVLKAYESMTGMGQLYIKEYAPNFASIHTIRAHLEKLNLSGFIPDLLVIDYADKMRSTRQFDSIRHELQLIYEELRGLASELGIPVWTASQANRDASQSDVVSLENIGEAYAKAQIADVILTLSRPEQAKATGFGKLFVAKNRAGRDGIVVPVKIDTARSKIEVIADEPSQTLGEARTDEANSIRAQLRAKWLDMKKEGKTGELSFKEPTVQGEVAPATE
jgi:replicative DNA helicase